MRQIDHRSDRVPTPFPHVGELRDRLRRLADDCEERARLSDSAEARGRYHGAAADARLNARARHLDEEGLRLALEAATAHARLAAWLDGDELAPCILPERTLQRAEAMVRHHEPSPPVSRPSDSLSASQLASLSGMSERGALKRIVNAYHERSPGFYRVGGRWFADRRAFEQFRMSSDCPTRAKVSP